MDPVSSSQNSPQSPIVAEVVCRPAPPPRKSRFWGRLGLLLLLLGLGGSLLLNLALLAATGISSADPEARVAEKYYSHQHGGPNKIAVISVEGVILNAEGFIKHQIDRAVADEHVKAVVLRINSPGGSVAASDGLYHYLMEKRKKKDIPVVVSMGDITASGGYYLAMAATPGEIFAEPATWTGSIGVLIPHYDLTGLTDHWGIKDDSIASHRLKTIGSMTKVMTKEERDILQELVNEAFARFKEIVCVGRPNFGKAPETLDKVATGQIFTAGQAKKNGLVDQIGFLDDAVDRAIKLAKLDEKEVEVVKYKHDLGLFGALMNSESRAAPLDLTALLDLAAPRAYYLCTWLPAVVTR